MPKTILKRAIMQAWALGWIRSATVIRWIDRFHLWNA